MKNLKLFSGIVFFAMFMMFNSCDKNREEIVTTGQDEFAEPLFQLDDIDEIDNPDLMEADEINPFRFRDSARCNPLRPCERKPDMRRKETRTHKLDAEPKSLPFILKQLNLDSTQKHAIRGFLKDYCNCLGEHHKLAIEINFAILKRANLARMEWLAKFKNGEITKAQLAEKLRNIHHELKENFTGDNNKKMHLEMVRKCQRNLFSKIATTLNARQKDKFHTWLENHK